MEIIRKWVDNASKVWQVIYKYRLWVVILLWLITVVCSFKYGYSRGSQVTDGELGASVEKFRTEAEASAREVERLTKQLEGLQGTTERITESNQRATGFIDRASENLGTASGDTETVAKDLAGVRAEMQQHLEESKSQGTAER